MAIETTLGPIYLAPLLGEAGPVQRITGIGRARADLRLITQL
jgi:hypothetical protein